MHYVHHVPKYARQKKSWRRAGQTLSWPLRQVTNGKMHPDQGQLNTVRSVFLCGRVITHMKIGNVVPARHGSHGGFFPVTTVAVPFLHCINRFKSTYTLIPNSCRHHWYFVLVTWKSPTVHVFSEPQSQVSPNSLRGPYSHDGLVKGCWCIVSPCPLLDNKIQFIRSAPQRMYVCKQHRGTRSHSSGRPTIKVLIKVSLYIISPVWSVSSMSV